MATLFSSHKQAFCSVVSIGSASYCTHAGGLEGEMATEVLPALRTIKLDSPEPGARSETLRLLGPFLVACEESAHPVVVDVVTKFWILCTADLL